MFFEFLNKLQQKPEGYKKRIAFLVSFILTIVIFVAWLGINLSKLNRSDSDVVRNSELPSNNPINVLKESFGDLKATLSESLGGIKESFANLENATSSEIYHEESQSEVSEPEPVITSSPVIILPY